MDYQKLALRFPALYASTPQKSLPLFAINTESTIPLLLHYIWLGSKELPPTFCKNMLRLSAAIKRKGGQTLFWTDHVRTLPGIRVLNVHSYFGTPENMRTYYQFRAALAKIPANYGEASDLLRYEILEHLGGYYLDFDIDPEEFSFTEMLAKGAKAPHGFVTTVIAGSPQNNAFGAIPRSPFLKQLQERVLHNYQTEEWKKALVYERPYLIDTTTFKSGPEAFARAIDAFFENSSTHTEESIQATFIPYASKKSAESWVFHRLEKSSQNYSEDVIRHDLILNLLHERHILDVAKYAYPHINTLVEALLKEYPRLFSSVDRLFTHDKKSYIFLQNLLQKARGQKIIWNELAPLKVASLFSCRCLITYLVKEKGINPFDSWQAHVGEYDCASASAFAIVLERGFKDLARTFITHDPKAAKECLKKPSSGLIYAGAALHHLTEGKPLEEFLPLKIALLEHQSASSDIIAHFQSLHNFVLQAVNT